MKTLPDSVANLAIGGDDGADVVQFVGGGNQASVGIGSSQMRDVVFLALPPGRFGFEIGIGAALDHVVQESGNGKVFIASGFEHQASYTQEMCNVGDGCALAVLTGVFAGREKQRPFKTGAK